MKNGWQTEALGDICEVIGGGTPSKDRPTYYSGNIPWATVRDMRQDVITETEFRITNKAVEESSTNIIPAGSVVIATRVGLGKVCLLGQDTAINQDLRGIIPRNKNILETRYLYWWFKSISDVIIAEGTGATVQGVKLPFVKSLQIPTPPLAEQKRIVQKLDDAFAGIAKAKENAEKNLQNVRNLFEGHLSYVLIQQGKGWEEKRLGDLCSIARGGSPRPIKKFLTTSSNGYNWVKISDATASGKFIHTTAQKIIREGATRSRIVQAGDFLLSNSMSFGRPYIMKTTGCVHDGWLVLSNYEEQLDQDYLYLCLGSQFMYEQFDNFAAGSTVRNLNIELASRVKIPVPPLSQQRGFAQQFNALSEKTKSLHRFYEQKLEALESLKKSILHEAFSGNL